MIAEVKIGPLVFAISYVERLQGDDHEPLFGQIDYANTTIKLDTQQSEQREVLTLWHEIVHGIFEGAGVQGQDEKLVDAVARGILQVLQDNPALASLSVESDLEIYGDSANE